MEIVCLLIVLKCTVLSGLFCYSPCDRGRNLLDLGLALEETFETIIFKSEVGLFIYFVKRQGYSGLVGEKQRQRAQQSPRQKEWRLSVRESRLTIQ